MQGKDVFKVVYRDGENTKAITCEILEEDDFFIKIFAIRTQTKIRIGKGSIVSIKPLGGQ